MDTGKLIEHLAEADGPVRPLAHPWRRTAAWLAIAIPYVALVVFVVSPRSDLVAKISESQFLIEQAAALATGIAAAAVWLASLGEGCVQEWIRFGPDGLSLELDWFCFPAIVLVGAIPAIAMAVMLRRGAPLTPHATTALGGLAAAGIGNFGLRLFHPQDASLMVLVWQLGAVCVLTAMAAWAGRHLLNWRSIIATGRRPALMR